MTDERNRLYLRYRAGEAAHKGQLEDYAVYTLALLELYRPALTPPIWRRPYSAQIKWWSCLRIGTGRLFHHAQGWRAAHCPAQGGL